MTDVDPHAPVTVRTTFRPSVDLQVSASEAMYLRRRGLLVPDTEEPVDTDGDGKKSGGDQEPPTGQEPDSDPAASPPASPPVRRR